MKLLTIIYFVFLFLRGMLIGTVVEYHSENDLSATTTLGYYVACHNSNPVSGNRKLALQFKCPNH